MRGKKGLLCSPKLTISSPIVSFLGGIIFKRRHERAINHHKRAKCGWRAMRRVSPFKSLLTDLKQCSNTCVYTVQRLSLKQMAQGFKSSRFPACPSTFPTWSHLNKQHKGQNKSLKVQKVGMLQWQVKRMTVKCITSQSSFGNRHRELRRSKGCALIVS